MRTTFGPSLIVYFKSQILKVKYIFQIITSIIYLLIMEYKYFTYIGIYNIQIGHVAKIIYTIQKQSF